MEKETYCSLELVIEAKFSVRKQFESMKMNYMRKKIYKEK